MRSPQNVSDPNSALAFVPAMVIAYLSPGQGDAVQRLILRSASKLPRDGQILNVNAYLIRSFPGNVETGAFLPHY
jgi:hypothetical protein